MKVDDLVATLARDDPRPARLGPTVTVTLAAIAALAVVLTISIAWLNPPAELVVAELASHSRLFVLKLIFTVSIVAAAVPIVRDLSVPGRRVGLGAILAAMPFVVLIVLALRELETLPVSEWPHHVDHAEWLECLWQIPALSTPAFIILVVAVRRLAPTNLVLTGSYVGLLAGGIGAVGHVLHCHDNEVAFVAFSYTAAIMAMALIGALLGPRVLRWT